MTAELRDRAKLVEMLIQLGTSHCYSGDYGKSIPHFLHALELDPTQTFIREYLASAYMHLEQYESAKDILIDALRDNSEEVWAYVGLAHHYSYVELNYGMARKLLMRALEIEPGCLQANHNLGCLYAGEGRYGEALAHFDAILAAQPGFAQAHYMRVMIYLEECQYSEASHAFDQYIEKADLSDAESAELLEEAKRSFSTQSCLQFKLDFTFSYTKKHYYFTKIMPLTNYIFNNFSSTSPEINS